MMLDDNALVAFADGELGAATAHEVEAIIAEDPAALNRVAMFRTTADWMRGAFDSPAIRVAQPAATVVALEPAPAPVKRASWRLAMPMAASIAAAFIAAFARFAVGSYRAGRGAGNHLG
jgi:anti-sigma factor RsiW